MWDLTLAMLVTGRKVSFATQFFFIPATLLTKISILLSYLRLAPPNTMFRRLSCECALPVFLYTPSWAQVANQQYPASHRAVVHRR